jgi:UDP-glucose 4-epimerase
MTTVAMLGATGNLGRAIGARLADRAWSLIEIPRPSDWAVAAEVNVDVVVNCAGAGMDSQRPITSSDLLEANLITAFSAARLAIASGARLVHLGSAAELAPGQTQASPYVRSKRLASDVLSMLAQTDGLMGFELLPHIVYGDPAPTAGGVIAAMIQTMSSGEVFGLHTPDLRRDFIHRDDVARAVVAAIETRTKSWETLEIGTGVGHSLSEVAEVLGRLLGVSDPWRSEPSQGRTWSEDLVADPAPARRRLNFHALIGMEDGLEQLVRDVAGRALA